MTPEALLLAELGVTVALLVIACWTGHKAKRKPHLLFVVATLAGLVVTILQAEHVGTLYDLEVAGRLTPIHLSIAYVATASFLLPIATGVMTWRNAARKKAHRACVLIAVVFTVAAAVTGTMMLMAAERL
jgi:hypothetical protein